MSIYAFLTAFPIAFSLAALACATLAALLFLKMWRSIPSNSNDAVETFDRQEILYEEALRALLHG